MDSQQKSKKKEVKERGVEVVEKLSELNGLKTHQKRRKKTLKCVVSFLVVVVGERRSRKGVNLYRFGNSM